MTQRMEDVIPASADLVGLGEPTHQEPAFRHIRNELFSHLVDRGFRSIALEIDRVAALTVNDFVVDGVGSIDVAMDEGFSHDWGTFDGNRQLVAWIRAYNEGRPAAERVTFHGFDAPMETMSAPSPRRYLEYARDYLTLDLDIADLAGPDERWSRTEAVLDPARSVGATDEARSLRLIADDMLTLLYSRAPGLIAATSRADWLRARTHLTAGLGLLRYHGQCARRVDETIRLTGLTATRDALMAQNLLDIRGIEADRGRTLVFSHNLHLRPNLSAMAMGATDVEWYGAGAIVASLGTRYAFVAGSLGRSEAIGLGEPDPATYEGGLQRRVATWGCVPADTLAPAATRTDTTPRQGYFPLDRETVAAADAVLHVNAGTVIRA